MKNHFYYSCSRRHNIETSDIQDVTCLNCLQLLSHDDFRKENTRILAREQLKKIKKQNQYKKEFDLILKDKK